MEQLQQLMSMMNAGCSALSWKTQDGKHLWGRNMTSTGWRRQQNQLYPARTSYYMRGTTMENNLREQERRTSAYAAVGTGF